MKQSIIQRIKDLGGNTDKMEGDGLEQLTAITFDTVLYFEKDDEHIYGLDEYIKDNMATYQKDEKAFFEMLTKHYYKMTDEGFGQHFWTAELFTPFKEGTPDYEEWHDDFQNDVDLTEITKVTNVREQDFIQLFYAYDFPDHLYISLSDPNPDNPTVFGTDHEVFFSEISVEGTLEEYLNMFFTKEELIELIQKDIKAGIYETK